MTGRRIYRTVWDSRSHGPSWGIGSRSLMRMNAKQPQKEKRISSKGWAFIRNTFVGWSVSKSTSCRNRRQSKSLSGILAWWGRVDSSREDTLVLTKTKESPVRPLEMSEPVSGWELDETLHTMTAAYKHAQMNGWAGTKCFLIGNEE